MIYNYSPESSRSFLEIGLDFLTQISGALRRY